MDQCDNGRLITLELDLPERIALLGILPHEGNIITLRLIKELQINVGFTEKEIKHFGLKEELKGSTQSITWNPEKASEKKEIEFGEVATALVVSRLKQLDSQGKLHIGMMPLYEKFVEGKE